MQDIYKGLGPTPYSGSKLYLALSNAHTLNPASIDVSSLITSNAPALTTGVKVIARGISTVTCFQGSLYNWQVNYQPTAAVPIPTNFNIAGPVENILMCKLSV